MMAKKPKQIFPPEAYETGTLPTWQQVKDSHSDAFWKKNDRRMAHAKKILAAEAKKESKS